MIQLQMLNWILENKDFSIITLNNIDKNYFNIYNKEFEYIKNHFDSYGNVPDKASFLSKFPSFDIVEVTETKEYLINELIKDRKKTYLTSSFTEMRDLIMNGDTDNAEGLLNKIVNNVPQFNNFNTIDLIANTDRYNEYIDKCSNFNNYYVTTSFPELDKFIGGWDRKEELATIVGRPGIGKSQLIFKCALAAAQQGLNVGIYEGEMRTNLVGYRIDTLISHISNGQLTHGNASAQQEYKEFLSTIKSKVKGQLKILTPDMIGGPATVSDLRTFIEKDKLDILYVDQYSLLEDENNAKNTVERTVNIAKDLKNLQIMKKIPIISASQQNREKEDKGVDLRQIAQSDRIGQNSTVVLFLEQKEDILTIHLVKSRYAGGGKSLKYKIDYDKGLYIYIPDEDNSSEEELKELKDSYEIINQDSQNNINKEKAPF